MLIDLEHLHFWMNAIRQSNDPKRTLDAFYKGQIQSKVWLVNELQKHIDSPVTIEIYGGWVGVLSSLIFQTSGIKVNSITSIDIDPTCKAIAEELNRIEFHQGLFKAETADMCGCSPSSDVIINTSCEHITQVQYDEWLTKVNTSQLLILQSNNYQIEEHVRIASDLGEFKAQANLSTVLYAGELELSLYKRFMIIGKK